jgi:hypothetical protein
VADRFERLAEAIAYQQLAGAAAAAIWGRVVALTAPGPFDPTAVLALSDEQLRGAGLSRSKVAALRELAHKVVDGSVTLHRLGRMSDDEVVAELTRSGASVRGGAWCSCSTCTASMSGPPATAGVRAGFGIACGLTDIPTPRELEAHGDALRPYRSRGLVLLAGHRHQGLGEDLTTSRCTGQRTEPDRGNSTAPDHRRASRNRLGALAILDRRRSTPTRRRADPGSRATRPASWSRPVGDGLVAPAPGLGLSGWPLASARR